MSSIQTLLVIGSLFLLTLVILTFYRANTEQMSSSVENEAIITATGFAQAMINQIQTRAYDEMTVSSYVLTADTLTNSLSLGPDAGEINVSQFDDLDDFNNYAITDTILRLGGYNALVKVRYVQVNSPETYTNSRTFSKRIDVFVTNQYIEDTLRVSHIVSY